MGIDQSVARPDNVGTTFQLPWGRAEVGFKYRMGFDTSVEEEVLHALY